MTGRKYVLGPWHADHQWPGMNAMQVVIPYRSIVAIDRVSAVLGEDAGAVPSFVKPSPAAGLVADALRFRTTDRKVRYQRPLAEF